MRHWKVITSLVVVGAACQPLAAWSNGYVRGAGDEFFVEAPVTYVQPLTRYIQVSTPQEVCWEESVPQAAYNQPSKTPLVVGGLIGGAIGHAVGGRRRSKNLLSVAGALLGASIGNSAASQHRAPRNTYVTTQRVCRIEQVTHQEERVDGYRVTYEYRGRSFVTQTATHPGATIPVRVEVQPLAYNGNDYNGRGNGRRPYRRSFNES